MQIGWIGLGNMGLGMACSAARAGHQVIGHSRGRAEHEALVANGGHLTSEFMEVVREADVVCINVFNDDQVRSVLYDCNVLRRLKANSILVVHTTGEPALVRRLQADAPIGVEVVDGAFSGSPAQAAAGELTMMIGGSERACDRVQPLFSSYSSFVRRAGPVGAGMQLKLLNNLLFAAQVRLAETAYEVATNEGFAVDAVADILTRCSGASRALEIVGARGQVRENLARMRPYLDKDVATALRSAQRDGLDLGVLGAVARGADDEHS
jgi:3-hydroxyisobutyrate dehydrogenase-like beta-hydroxyacid dehydrogenase